MGAMVDTAMRTVMNVPYAVLSVVTKAMT